MQRQDVPDPLDEDTREQELLSEMGMGPFLSREQENQCVLMCPRACVCVCVPACVILCTCVEFTVSMHNLYACLDVSEIRI